MATLHRQAEAEAAPAQPIAIRREGRQPWPLRYIPNGRGRGIAADVRRNPVADHPAAGAARIGVTGKWIEYDR
jgi:hypothetical protein